MELVRFIPVFAGVKRFFVACKGKRKEGFQHEYHIKRRQRQSIRCACYRSPGCKGSEHGPLQSGRLAKIDGENCDLRTVIDRDCTLSILTFDDPDGKKAFWHTASHILAQAVKHLYPDARLASDRQSTTASIMILTSKSRFHRRIFQKLKRR